MTKAATLQLQKRIALTLMFGSLMLFALYVYFLCASVMHVVMRTEHEHLAKKMQTEISQLEGEYILAHHEVSQRIASLDGYTTITQKQFIDRSQSSLVLETNVGN